MTTPEQSHMDAVRKAFLAAYEKPQNHHEDAERRKTQTANVGHLASSHVIVNEVTIRQDTGKRTSHHRPLEVFTPSAQWQDEEWARWHDLEDMPVSLPLGGLGANAVIEEPSAQSHLQPQPIVSHDKMFDALTRSL